MEFSSQYWAGLFDGEGCIQPYYYVSKKHGEKFVVAFRVSVSQKEPMILYHLQNQFGGYVRTSPITTATGFKTYRGQWELSKTDGVLAFLSVIRPYIFIKDVEVKVATEILEGVLKSRSQYVRSTSGGGFAGKQEIPLEEIKKRQVLEKRFYEDRRSNKRVQLVPTIITEEPHA